jgi:hypothetical protein
VIHFLEGEHPALIHQKETDNQSACSAVNNKDSYCRETTILCTEVFSMLRIVATLLLLCSFAFAGASHSGSKPSAAHSTKTHSSTKTVHVRGYYRKDGTYVAPHERSAPATATSSLPSSTASHAYRRNYLAEGYSLHPSVIRDKNGKIKRSSSAKASFERQSPCPSTGRTNGRCPGYIIDHVNPLECGGADAPSNMQWQTTSDAKAKDKTEGNCRL